MADSRIVPRRRVRVRLELVDGSTIEGDAYVAVRAVGGRPELLLDRLNAADERFLPIAVEERHDLVRKSAIVVARTQDDLEVAEARTSAAERRLHLEVRLAVGPPVEGSLPAAQDVADERALDHLNALDRDFAPLLDAEGLVLVNLRHVARVTERTAGGGRGPR